MAEVNLSYTAQEIDRKLGQAHEHRNKTALNQISEINGQLAYRNNVVGSGGAFDLSMLAGSGVLQSQIVDISRQRHERIVTETILTSRERMWHLYPQHSYRDPIRNPAWWYGGIEIDASRPRNTAILRHVDDETNNIPIGAPVDLDNKPPLYFNHTVHGQSARYATAVNDYVVEKIVTDVGLETYLISGTFEGDIGEKFDFKIAISGEIDYYDPTRIRSLGKDFGFMQSSILLDLHEDSSGGVSVWGVYFDTGEEIEWTNRIPIIRENVIVIDETFVENDRFNVEMHYPLTGFFEDSWGIPDHTFNFYLNAQNVRKGVPTPVTIENEFEPDIIGQIIPLHASLLITNDGVSLEISPEDKRFPSSWWGVDYEWGAPVIDYMETVRRL